LTVGLHFSYRRLIIRTSKRSKTPPCKPEVTCGVGIVRFLFEDFAFDIDRRELHRGSDVVSVAPQVFDLLEYLIRNRERVVSKDELINAVWNGRIVSDAALTTRVNAARIALRDSGQEQRLIKTLPRKGVRFVGTVREAEKSGAVGDTTAQPISARLLPDKPSVAVLPFKNLSSDPEQDYFADGMAEEIITALSRFKALLVIAGKSSFTYKGRTVDVKQVGRELAVRYVLEGSVRKAANRVRITGQLVDTSSGAHLWADRFEGELGDIFALQDQVTERVVGAIAPAVEKAEIERAKNKPTGSLDAYTVYLRGLSRLFEVTSREANEEALRLFNRAIELDPDFASAYGRAASCYAYAKGFSWIFATANEIAEVRRLARCAVELGKDDAIALANSAWALANIVGDFEQAAALIDRALLLNSNLADAWFAAGWIKNWSCEPEPAIECFAHAMRLNPFDPRIEGIRTGIAYSHFLLARYDEAASWAAMALRDSPDFPPGLRVAAASNAMVGRPEMAHKAMARLRQLVPDLRVSNIKDVVPHRRTEDLATYEDALRRAGLPE
jgi:TolB-like protein